MGILENVRTLYLALFHSDEKHEKTFDRIRYLIMLKGNISDLYSHRHTKIIINSGDDLLLEKTYAYATCII